MKEKRTDSIQTEGSLASPRDEIRRKLEEARFQLKMLDGRHESSGGIMEAGRSKEAEEDLETLQNEVMWLETQLQALDAGMGMFSIEPQDTCEGKLQKLGIMILKEGEQRRKQFEADLQGLEVEVWKVRKLYLELISKIAAILREADRTAFVLDRVNAFVPPGDRVVKTTLRRPEWRDWVIGLEEVRKAFHNHSRSQK